MKHYVQMMESFQYPGTVDGDSPRLEHEIIPIRLTVLKSFLELSFHSNFSPVVHKVNALSTVAMRYPRYLSNIFKRKNHFCLS